MQELLQACKLIVARIAMPVMPMIPRADSSSIPFSGSCQILREVCVIVSNYAAVARCMHCKSISQTVGNFLRAFNRSHSEGYQKIAANFESCPVEF